MMRAGGAILGAVFMLAGLSACDLSNVREAAFSTPAGDNLTARAGDTVMDVRIVRPPLSAIGLLDGVVAKRETGRVLVRFTGAQRGRAIFVRQDLVMNDSDGPPLWVPVGVASPTADYAAAAQPIALSLAPGEYLPLEGRRLIVRRADPNTLDYTLE